MSFSFASYFFYKPWLAGFLRNLVLSAIVVLCTERAFRFPCGCQNLILFGSKRKKKENILKNKKKEEKKRKKQKMNEQKKEIKKKRKKKPKSKFLPINKRVSLGKQTYFLRAQFLDF